MIRAFRFVMRCSFRVSVARRRSLRAGRLELATDLILQVRGLSIPRETP